MPKPAFSIKPYKHLRLKFVVRSKISGKWKRKFFHTKSEAKTHVQLKEIELLNQGREGAIFPTSLRVMAQREAERLDPFGKTISDAVDFYLKHLEATARSVPLNEAMRELVRNRKSNGASRRYCYDIELRIQRFCDDFPSKNVAEITTRDVDNWLGGLELAPVTRNTFRRDLRTFFSFAKTRRYCVENPVVGTSKAQEVGGDIKILSVEQVTSLLESASEKTLPFWALGAFAGLRPAELERLDWDQLDFESNLLEVKARHSKTRTRRFVTLEPNLQAWLSPYRLSSGRICPENPRKLLEADRDRAGLLVDWPQNALRHSFGSYHLAHFKNAPALALQMGNSPDVIFKHYRELVKPADAALYWQIVPNRVDK
jgi:integrase